MTTLRSRTRSPRWTTPGEVYAYRTRKPGALLGLPLLGRHWAYGGQTRNPKARHGEHIRGGGRYGRAAQPWADLSPKRYVLFRLAHCPQWVLDLVEVLVIRTLFPVYNVQHNRGNLRRVKPAMARLQRAQRDRMGWSFTFTPAHFLMVLGAAAMVVMVVYR